MNMMLVQWAVINVCSVLKIPHPPITIENYIARKETSNIEK